MDQSDFYADAFLRRAAGFIAKAAKAQSPESTKTYLDLAKMYEDMAHSVEELERLEALVRASEEADSKINADSSDGPGHGLGDAEAG